jgi:hypothetical protein
MGHLTANMVRQVPPLVEADLFRAITFLPMVSQPNDLKGRIHLAGGSSDATRHHAGVLPVPTAVDG